MVTQNRKRAMALLSSKLLIACGLITCVFSAFTWWRSQAAIATDKRETPRQAILPKLPLRFEANQGQADPRVKFLARGQAAQIWLTERTATLQVSGQPLTLTWLNAQQPAKIEGLEPLTERSHYLRGTNPKHWQTDVPHYARVRYARLYPGIDLVFYDREQKLEYDFVIAPGHNARNIRWQFSGQRHLLLNEWGALVLQLAGGVTITQPAPIAYQETTRGRVPVNVQYRLLGNNRVGFSIGDYDRQLPLVIDPVLEYSTLLGGASIDEAFAMRVDRFGNSYLVGRTHSTDFPGNGTIQARFGGEADAFVMKVNAAGTAIEYATYLGGRGFDYATALALGTNETVFMTGVTYSTDFPLTTPNTNKGYSDVFVARLSANGSQLEYSTMLGGNGIEIPYGIGVNNAGQAFIAGRSDSADLPNAARLGQSLYRSTDRGSAWNASATGLTSYQTNGLAAGRGTQANTLYAATSQGLFKSTDGGTNWQPTNLRNIYCWTVAVDPRDAQVIFVGTERGLFKSTNGGADYTNVPYDNNTTQARNVYHFAFDPTQPDTIYLATLTGLYKSTNGGTGFMRLFATFGQVSYVNYLAIDPTNRQTIYAASDLGITKSLDGGINWKLLPLPATQAHQIVIDPTTPRTLYAGVNQNAGGLLKSTDGGETWATANRGLLATAGANAQFISVHHLALDSTSSSTLYAASFNGGLFRSTDSGATWNRALNGLNNLLVSDLQVEESGRLWAGTIAGSDVLLAQINPSGDVTNLRLLGGSESDEARAVVVDQAGSIYLTGGTQSLNFPTRNPLQSNNRGLSVIQPTTDAFLAKLNQTGAELIYSTYLGGNAGDVGTALALDAAGNMVIAGQAASNDFPTTLGVFKPVKFDLNQDAFVAKFNSTGTALQFATYLGGGGQENVASVALDNGGNVYVAGTSSSADFPTVNGLPPATSSNYDKAFFSKFSSNAATLTFSTLMGGNSFDTGTGIFVSDKRDLYVSGSTSSTKFPTLNQLGARPDSNSNNAFLARFAAEADLGVTSQAAANPVQAGQSYRYTASVTNYGPDEAVGVVLNDIIPLGLSNVSATASTGGNACTINANNLQCRLGELGNGAVATVTLTGTAPAVGTLNQAASVTSNTPDGVSNNQRATLATTVSLAPSIAGLVSKNGTPLADVTLSIRNGLNATKTSDVNGTFQFAELTKGGSYTVTAARAGYVIRPQSFNFEDLQSDKRADFTATACRFTITPTQRAFLAAGGNGTLNITATDQACAWQVRSTVPWLVISGSGNGAGNGTLNFTVAPGQSARSGLIGLRSQGVSDSHLVTVTQEFEACVTPDFQVAPSFGVEGTGTELSYGDTNGDGNTDLIWLNAELNSASVWLGDGKGAFASTARVVNFGAPAFNSNKALAIGDINGDGRTDLAALAGTPAELVTVFGNADGTFSALRKAALPAATSYLTLARINGDNRADAVIYNRSNNSLQVLLAGTGGTFGAISAGVRIALTSILEGDLNRDGKTDLVAVNTSPMIVLLGDGAGNFTPGTQIFFTSSFQPTGVLADFSRDGNLDIAVSASSGSSARGIQLFKGNGAGGFSAPVLYEGAANQLLAHDLNRDGALDLVAIGTSVSFSRNNGDGTFANPVNYHVGVLLNGVAVGDFNRDGRDEFAFPISYALNEDRLEHIAILASNGLEWRAGLVVPLTAVAALQTVADFNNDGFQDALLRGSEQFILRLGNGANSFPTEIKTNFNGPVFSVSARDYNQDGNLDLITENGFSISLWAGDGRGGFQSPRQIQVYTTQESNPQATSLPMVWGDFNRDNRLDFATITPLRQPLLYFGQGNGAFTAPLAFGGGMNLNQLATGDFNGDGRLDIVGYNGLQCSTDSTWIAYYQGNAAGSFDAPLRSHLEITPTQTLAEDMDGDGRAELLLFGSCAAFGMAKWQSNGSFNISQKFPVGFGPAAIAVADVNNDARKDILMIRPGPNQSRQIGPNALQVMTANNSGGFNAPLTLVQSIYESNLAVGDFNGDTRTDVLTGGGSFGNQATLTIFNNNCFSARALALASAASYGNATLAPDSIIAAFGSDLGLVTAPSRTRPLPEILEGTRVNVVDAVGNQRNASLFFVSPTQVNFLMPAGLAAGNAQITITNGNGILARTNARIASTAPGLFAANSNGQGVPAAFVLRVRSDGLQFTEPVARYDNALNRFVAVPIEFGAASDQLYLVLYGTAIRGRSALQAVTCQLGGQDVPVLYAGAQPDLVGLDQINVALPRSLQGRGDIELKLTVEGQTSNTLRVTMR